MLLQKLEHVPVRPELLGLVYQQRPFFQTVRVLTQLRPHSPPELLARISSNSLPIGHFFLVQKVLHTGAQQGRFAHAAFAHDDHKRHLVVLDPVLEFLEFFLPAQLLEDLAVLRRERRGAAQDRALDLVSRLKGRRDQSPEFDEGDADKEPRDSQQSRS